jgi:hypothetical protein
VWERCRALVMTPSHRGIHASIARRQSRERCEMKAQRPAGETVSVAGRAGWALNVARTGERVVK